MSARRKLVSRSAIKQQDQAANLELLNSSLASTKRLQSSTVVSQPTDNTPNPQADSTGPAIVQPASPPTRQLRPAGSLQISLPGEPNISDQHSPNASAAVTTPRNYICPPSPTNSQTSSLRERRMASMMRLTSPLAARPGSCGPSSLPNQQIASPTLNGLVLPEGKIPPPLDDDELFRSSERSTTSPQTTFSFNSPLQKPGLRLGSSNTGGADATVDTFSLNHNDPSTFQSNPSPGVRSFSTRQRGSSVASVDSSAALSMLQALVSDKTHTIRAAAAAVSPSTHANSASDDFALALSPLPHRPSSAGDESQATDENVFPHRLSFPASAHSLHHHQPAPQHLDEIDLIESSSISSQQCTKLAVPSGCEDLDPDLIDHQDMDATRIIHEAICEPGLVAQTTANQGDLLATSFFRKVVQVRHKYKIKPLSICSCAVPHPHSELTSPTNSVNNELDDTVVVSSRIQLQSSLSPSRPRPTLSDIVVCDDTDDGVLIEALHQQQHGHSPTPKHSSLLQGPSQHFTKNQHQPPAPPVDDFPSLPSIPSETGSFVASPAHQARDAEQAQVTASLEAYKRTVESIWLRCTTCNQIINPSTRWSANEQNLLLQSTTNESDLFCLDIFSSHERKSSLSQPVLDSEVQKQERQLAKQAARYQQNQPHDVTTSQHVLNSGSSFVRLHTALSPSNIISPGPIPTDVLFAAIVSLPVDCAGIQEDNRTILPSEHSLEGTLPTSLVFDDENSDAQTPHSDKVVSSHGDILYSKMSNTTILQKLTSSTPTKSVLSKNVTPRDQKRISFDPRIATKLLVERELLSWPYTDKELEENQLEHFS